MEWSMTSLMYAEFLAWWSTDCQFIGRFGIKTWRWDLQRQLLTCAMIVWAFWYGGIDAVQGFDNFVMEF